MSIQGKIAARKAAQNLTREIDQATDVAIPSEAKSVSTEELTTVSTATIQELGQSGLRSTIFSTEKSVEPLVEEKDAESLDMKKMIEQKNSTENARVGVGEGLGGKSGSEAGSQQGFSFERPLKANTEPERLAESAPKASLIERTIDEAEKSQNGSRSDSGGSQAYSKGGNVWRAGSASEMFALPGHERVRSAEALEAARRELVRDEQEIMEPEKYVGEESALQVQERLAEDEADLKRELDLETGKAKMTADGERLTKEAVKHIEEVIAKKAEQPRRLEEALFLGMTKFLEQNYGRKFGDRN